jgi:GR25 family glycosyltransferase involved in LPS biosynthesis
MNSKTFKNYCIVVCIFVLVWIYWKFTEQKEIPITDLWVINLDKDIDRWNNIRQDTIPSVQIHRWPATVGANVKRGHAHLEGVTQMVMLLTDSPPEVYYKKTDADNNQETIGRWLSHKRLLTYLSSVNLSDDYAHLIVEDDIQLHEGFVQEWARISKKVPNDWDMIYLSITKPNVRDPIIEPVYRGVPTYTDTGNRGTYAYIVKHGSLRHRILPALRFMTHEIDVQLNMQFDHLHVYCIPNLIRKRP